MTRAKTAKGVVDDYNSRFQFVGQAANKKPSYSQISRLVLLVKQQAKKRLSIQVKAFKEGGNILSPTTIGSKQKEKYKLDKDGGLTFTVAPSTKS